MFAFQNNLLNNVELKGDGENDHQFSQKNKIIKRTLEPITTGTSVLAVTYDGGVMIAADILASYGSLARFRSCPRVQAINNSTLVGYGGDYADCQYLLSIIEQKVIDDESLDDGFTLKPKALYTYLTRVLYNRRSKFNPLWTNFIIGGLEKGIPFLGTVDKLGTAYAAPTIATGYGSLIAQPILRDAYEKKNAPFTYDEARKLIIDCMTIMYLRDGRAFDKYTIGIVDGNGSRVEGPYEVNANWEICNFRRPS